MVVDIVENAVYSPHNMLACRSEHLRLHLLCRVILQVAYARGIGTWLRFSIPRPIRPIRYLVKMVGVGSGRCHFRLRTASFVRRLPDRMVAISAKVVFLDRQRLLRSFLHPLFPKSLLHSFSSTHVCSHLWTSSSIHVSWWRLVQRKVGPRLHQIVLWWRWIESVLEILWLVVWHRNRRHHITLVAPSLRWIEWRRVEWSLLVKQVTLCSRLSVSLITWSCVIGVWIVIVMTVMTVIQFLRFIRSD